uniref:Uncharacterized protein n=1 Tax=Anguilla anguilla TaxID=7936 RepID=A0A0E9PDG6_ANGAN
MDVSGYLNKSQQSLFVKNAYRN